MTKVILVHASWCHVCPAAKKLWQSLKEGHDFDYDEVDFDTPEGEKLAEEYSIMSVPTTIIDGKVAFVGVPNKEKAVSMLS
ncbi:glutaredoxin family protein [Methanococcoides burtonii]|uniref:Protein disulfide oxidoreductase n=1 Tax=Methanococcoides burtonii (strain DSM 6242 / NBRC 107633 / OCM 468 / ACE-M) TaxID=259564 RepID=Q12ZK6_METBU|nr:thioredoxin family protein [Methanococcoides burtonii]ABE51120.1 protein disulfide oxidoreductase [Methanococcoides burtonii DSM 6242]